jgi:DDE family transposase
MKCGDRATAASARSLAVESRLRRPERSTCPLTQPTSLEMTHCPISGHPEVWLLAERDHGATPRTKYYLVHLPASASLRALVQLAHQRWAIEQQYQELKDELGFDHFEGRSWPGWQRHAVLTALAHTFLQVERQRLPSRTLTLPRVRAILQEVLTAHLFVTRPHYLHRMLKLQQVSLRI